MAVAAAPEVPGFHALSPLGAGPTSTMFSAQSEQLGRWVALLIYGRSTSDGDPARFRKAFGLARRLGVHPHAVTVLDCGITPDRRPYIVTEFYEHGTFDSRVAGDNPLPLDKTLRIGIAVAGALETAHRAKIIHRGVHPARLLADHNDEPSLADLGLVPLVDHAGTQALLGPLNHHAPPEVLEGDTLGVPTDIYGLASAVFTLLTARPPFWVPDPEDTPAALLLRILRQDIQSLGGPAVPPSLEAALRAALHCDPNQRPATALAFAQSLQAVQRELGLEETQPVLLDVASGMNEGLEERFNGDADHMEPPSSAATLPPAPDPLPPPGPTPFRQVFVPYPVPESDEDGQEAVVAAPEPPAAPVDAPPVVPQSWDEPPPAPVAPLAPPEPPIPAPLAGEASHPDDRPLHERLATANPWPPAPEAAPVAPVASVAQPPPENLRLGDLGDAEEKDPKKVHNPPSLGARIVHGPRALPVIVLGIIVAVLLAAAVWMVVSGSDPSGATTPEAAASA